jgi:hypothetical protein
LLFKCGSKDSTPAPSITLTINDKSESVTFSSALLQVESTGNKGRSLVINASSGVKLLNIAISCWEYQGPPADGMVIKTYYDITSTLGLSKATCKQVGAETLCDTNLVTWVSSLDSSTGLYMAGIYDGPEYESIVKVTSNDAGAKRISGEFDVKVQNGSGDVLTLKGKFSNISYSKQTI